MRYCRQEQVIKPTGHSGTASHGLGLRGQARLGYAERFPTDDG